VTARTAVGPQDIPLEGRSLHGPVFFVIAAPRDLGELYPVTPLKGVKSNL